MQCGNQCDELIYFYVLEFVDEECKAAAVCPRGLAHDTEQVLQVGFQVSVVGQSRFGVNVQGDLDVLVFHLQGIDEPCESSHCTLREDFRGLSVREFQQG